MIGRRSIARPLGKNLQALPVIPGTGVTTSNLCMGPPSDNRIWVSCGLTSPSIVAAYKLDGSTPTAYTVTGAANNDDFGGICTDGTSIWLGDSTQDSIYQIDPSTGAVIASQIFSSQGVSGVAGVQAASNGNIYFADPSSNKVYSFSIATWNSSVTGTTASVTLTPHTPPTSGSGPHGLNLGTDGAGTSGMWWVESAISKVAFMSLAGVITEYPMYTSSGVANGGLYYTWNDDKGDQWFSDRGGNHLLRLKLPVVNTPDWSIWPTSGSDSPGGCSRDGRGNQVFCYSSTNKLASIPNNAPKQFHASDIVQIARNTGASGSQSATFDQVNKINGGVATAGNTLLAIVSSKSGTTAHSAPTDNLGGSYTQWGSTIPGTNCSTSFWLKGGATNTAVGGEKTITGNSNNTSTNVWLVELGPNVIGLDGTPTGTTAGPAVNNITIGSQTPSTGHTIFITFVQLNGSNVTQFSNSWNSQGFTGGNSEYDYDSHEEIASYYTTATTAQSSKEFWAGSNNACALSAMFKLAAAPAAQVSPISELAMTTGSTPDKPMLAPDGNVFIAIHNSPGGLQRYQPN